ncbi:hypothetical protein [Sinomonas sp. P47F7]|uniref:hypothetical protein n=1 Tax=Sinomonas sp. P47F7 TaxID=3410987 RepID=UPI003BF4D8D8
MAKFKVNRSGGLAAVVVEADVVETAGEWLVFRKRSEAQNSPTQLIKAATVTRVEKEEFSDTP